MTEAESAQGSKETPPAAVRVDFRSYLEELRPEIDSELDRLLPSDESQPRRLHEAMRYAVFAGGKRVRPVLVVLAGETLGAPRSQLLPAAAAMEMVHTFSLVHDDLPALDNDDLRRGQPTVHRAYDEALAVLVGDALLNHALGVVASEPPTVSASRRLAAVTCLIEAIGSRGMIGGQVSDLEAEQQFPTNAAAVLESIHRRKTGALMVASLRLGGILAGGDDAADVLLGRIGDGIGLLFQIADDILDVEGDTAALGKTAGKDVEAEKLTFPRVYGLEGSQRRLLEARDETLSAVDELLGVAADAPGRVEILRSLVRYLAERDR